MKNKVQNTVASGEHKDTVTCWLITRPETGEALHHVHTDGKGVTFAGLKWDGVFAYQWKKAASKATTFFNKQGALDIAKAYTLLTGEAVKVVKVDIE